LSDNQLEPLRAAIKDARSEFSDLSDEINDTFDDVTDRLDELLGNEAGILERKFKREMEEMQDLLSRATAAGNEALINQVKTAIRNLKKAQKLEKKELDESTSLPKQEQKTPTSSSGGEVTVNINLPNGSTRSVDVASQGDADTLVSALNLLGEININGVS